MLSRVASSIYWMSRYLERADNVTRFVKVNMHLILDLGLDQGNSRWESLINASGDQEDFKERYGTSDEKNVLYFLTFDRKNKNSILSSIERARENARSVRENIPSEMWESINQLHHHTQKHSRKRGIIDLQQFYTYIHKLGYMLAGYCDSMMLRDEAWHFLNLGRMLERADKTARLVDIKYFFLSARTQVQASSFDTVEWAAVLRSANSFEMYLKEYHVITQRDVTEFLICDSKMPRSVAFCVDSAAGSLAAIEEPVDSQTVAGKEMATLRTSLEHSNIDHIITNGLHEFIDIFQYNLNIVDEAIYKTYFHMSAQSPVNDVSLSSCISE